jgi:hypothetical protein
MKIKYQYIIAFTIILSVFSACTKLKDTSYNQIISSEFTPTSSELPALAGAAYVDWRGLLLKRNTV